LSNLKSLFAFSKNIWNFYCRNRKT